MINTETKTPRIKPIQSQRNLNEHEQLVALLLSANIHGLIRDMDDLQETTLYRQKVKQTAKAFPAELEKHAKEQVWSGEIEGVSISAAADQLEHLSRTHRNLLFTLLRSGEMDESQLILF